MCAKSSAASDRRATGRNVSTAMDSETTLVDQPRGKELEYRVLRGQQGGRRRAVEYRVGGAVV